MKPDRPDKKSPGILERSKVIGASAYWPPTSLRRMDCGRIGRGWGARTTPTSPRLPRGTHYPCRFPRKRHTRSS